MSIRHLGLAILIAAGISACGGGGGDDNPGPPPTPSVTLTATPTTVTVGGTVSLTWSSANATACSASGGWTGARATSGTEQTAALTTNTTYTITCGSAVASAPVTVTQPPPTTSPVSGQLHVPANVQSDSDTNDSSVTPVANNSFATSQTLPNPVIVGGYVTEAGAGESGPVQAAGDPSDYFRVSLLQGQVIELTVANPSPDANDLDLELYSNGQALVDESVGISRVEQLVVPATGQYFIRVLAFSGASNYLLTIGQTGSAVAPGFTLSRDFVSGELLVKTRGTGASVTTQSLANELDLEVVQATPGSYSLMRIGTGTSRWVAQSYGAQSAADTIRSFASETVRQKSETLRAWKRLAKRSDIAWTEPNWIVRASAVPNDPLYVRQRWHYELMQLPAAWDVTTGNASVIAAVVDTGVRPHAELAARLADGYDFVQNDTDASDPGQAAQGSYFFHGTHVAGTIGAASNDGQGVAGVAWTVRLMPVRVLNDQGSGSFNDIVQGILYAARLANRSGRLPPTRADVINLSLGALGPCPQALQQAINDARAAGSVIVAAAGNENTSTTSFPAACNGVISVSALDARSARAPYSNFGTTVDVGAPGGDVGSDRDGDGNGDGIYSTHSSRNTNGTYSATHTYLQGTSMASPHVAGVIALMRSVNPALTPAAIDTLIENGSITDDIGAPGRDELGVGRINARKAVTAASTNPPSQPARLSVTPSSLSFGIAGSSEEVLVSNAGSGAISVTGTSVSAPWLTVTPVAVDANGLGRYRIQVNRAGLANGVYSGSVEFRSSPTASTRVSVLMEVASTAIESSAGPHYLLLIDANTGESRYQVEVLARGTSLAFSFPNVAHGQYELAVGTDANNDGLICDDGEACGQYPVYGQPDIIEVNAPVSGLIVTTSYHTDVAPQRANASSTKKVASDTARGFRLLQ
jgi:serine protease